MLTQYQTITENLLQLPQAPSSLYSPATLTTYINIARGQLCGETECLRAIGTVNTVAGQQAYPFSGIGLGTPATTGIQGVINVRRIMVAVGQGQAWIPPRAWEWFDLYVNNQPQPPVNQATLVTGSPPSDWAQYQRGAAPTTLVGTNQVGGGSFYINIPDDVYTLNCDCSCYPIALANDSTVEAIPYLFTDAVPYFAAYMALLSSQAQARMADALRYFEIYKTFIERAATAGNPSVTRYLYEQADDVAQAGKFGIKKGG